MKEGLTGKRRHRVLTRWWRRPLLVLQVHEVVVIPDRRDEVDGGFIRGGWYQHWRDARVEDLERGE